ncbi:hypothetical protein [Luteolibacter sp. Populi]|uniref:hypothetical protein n=1 Tax=Luteolibacter sp. Populi TaxID=3230487 RepID=UPI003466572E
MTYLIAGVMGWGVVAVFHGSPGAGKERKSESRTQRAATAIPTGRDILARLETERKLHAGRTEERLTDDVRALLEKHLAALPPSGDPAADVRDAVAKLGDLDELAEDLNLLEKKFSDRIDIAAKFHRWMEHDRQAALEYVNGFPEESYGPLASGASYGLELWAAKADPEKLKDLILANPDKGSSFLMVLGLGTQTGAAGDLASVTKLYQEMKPGMLREFSGGVAEHWPVERVGELADFAMAQSNSFLLSGTLKRMKPEEAAGFLNAAFEAGGNEEALKQFSMNGGLSLLSGFTGELGFDETVALQVRFYRLNGDSPSARGTAERNALGSEVFKVLDRGGLGDVLQSFAEGKVEASGLLAAVQSALPELSASHPDLLRDQVYGAILRRNPIAAVELYAGIPEAERYQKLNAGIVYTIGTTPGPQDVYDLFEAVPHKPEFGSLQSRERAWNRVSAMSYSIYGDDYIEWMRKLPAGMNRDMALTAMAAQLEKNDPGQAAVLRAEKSQK